MPGQPRQADCHRTVNLSCSIFVLCYLFSYLKPELTDAAILASVPGNRIQRLPHSRHGTLILQPILSFHLILNLLPIPNAATVSEILFPMILMPTLIPSESLPFQRLAGAFANFGQNNPICCCANLVMHHCCSLLCVTF